MDAIEFVKQLRRMNEQGVPKKRFIYGLTDRQVLAVARDELSLEEIMLLNQTQEETKQHG